MKKIMFLLMMMCILFTGCKKDQETEQNLNAETTSIQMQTNSDDSDTERLSATTTASLTESADADISTNQTSSAEKSSSQTSVTTSTKMNPSESTEVSLDAENALQQAIMDKEKKAAIDAVLETEEPIYYKDPALDFDTEGYTNLHIEGFGFSIPGSGNSSNVHRYFFELKPMSGTDILYLQKACEGYSGITFDVDQVKSSTGKSLEDSECLTYQNDSAYLELHQDGTCMMYNKENISGILGQKIPSGIWTPLQGSQSKITIYSEEEWDAYIPNENEAPVPKSERIYPLNGENVSIEEASDFLYDYFTQSTQSLATAWISSNYLISVWSAVTVDLIEYENGSYGYYFTIPIQTADSRIRVDSTERTAYLHPDRAVKGQYVQVLMLSKDSVDYLYLPPTLTKSPDYQQTLPGTYCTLAEACEILSAYLSPDHVYDVDNIDIFSETVFLEDSGIVQSPMWHIEVTSLTGDEAQYSTLYADIDLETKELYISYN